MDFIRPKGIWKLSGMICGTMLQLMAKDIRSLVFSIISFVFIVRLFRVITCFVQQNPAYKYSQLNSLFDCFPPCREDGELEDGEIDDEGIGIEEENKEATEVSEEKEREKEKEKAKEKEEKAHRHSRKRYKKTREKRRSKRRRRDRQKVRWH